MKKQFLIILFILSACFVTDSLARADTGMLAKKLAGKILLQVESHGEAWYINPKDLKKYYLGRPDDAFSLMRALGIGITDSDLKKFSVGLISDDNIDTDGDGLPDDLEKALGIDPNKNDSDSDGYSDLDEIKNNYNPSGSGKLNIDVNFSRLNAGKIFLQTEQNGEAWYINPADAKKYYLGRPNDAFALMKKTGLGITTSNLNLIVEGKIISNEPAASTTSATATTTDDGDNVIYSAADALRKNNVSLLMSYFTPEMNPMINYITSTFDGEQRLGLGNILSGSQLSSSTDTEKTYTNSVYFSLGGYNVPLKFIVKKQPDGKWLMTNL